MVLESGVSVIFPLLGSVFSQASRFPPSGPIRVRFPALAGTPEMLCHLLSFRPHFVSFVWLVPPFRTLAVRVRRLFRGLLWRLVRSASRPGLFGLAVCPFSALLRWRSAGFPSFWEDPYSHALLPRPRWTSMPRLFRHFRSAFRSFYSV